MLPLGGLLARSLPVSSGQGAQPLRDFSRLDDVEINTAVEVFSAGLKRLLIPAQATSRLKFENMDKKAFEASKDLADGVSAVSKFKTFKMSKGTVTDFYEGLSSRTGMLNCFDLILYNPFPLAAKFPLAANIFRPIEFELT
jgi:hypothetical protein